MCTNYGRKRYSRKKLATHYRTYSESAVGRLQTLEDAEVDVARKLFRDEVVLEKV